MPSFALLIWPLCAFFVGRKLPFQQALIWGTIVPYLFLPEAFAINLPGLPDLDKTMIVSLGLLIIFVVNRSSLNPAPQESEAPLLRFLLLVGVIMILTAPSLTVLNNQETLRFGPTVIPGLPLKESVTEPIIAALTITPYYFARRYLATPQAHRKMLLVLTIMGLLYSALMLVEIQLSPQLHRWIYGFHQHSFVQHIRDGYRPMVFLYHGLFVGFFICTCVLAALGLWKAGQGKKWLIAAGWLLVMLVMSNNLGATVICFLMIAVYLGTGRWVQILFAMCIGFVIFLYPIFRGTGLVPVEEISAAAARVSEARSRSLNYRLANEDIALERALEKPLAGWGRWGRNQGYNEAGEVVTIQEGVWIQAITVNGWYGYLGLFSVLTLPAMFMVGVWRRKEIPPETFALMAITTGNLIYMIPTTLLTPVSWMTYGALTGFMLTRAQGDETETKMVGADASVSHYTRFAGTRTPTPRERSAAGVGPSWTDKKRR